MGIYGIPEECIGRAGATQVTVLFTDMGTKKEFGPTRHRWTWWLRWHTSTRLCDIEHNVLCLRASKHVDLQATLIWKTGGHGGEASSASPTNCTCGLSSLCATCVAETGQLAHANMTADLIWHPGVNGFPKSSRCSKPQYVPFHQELRMQASS